MQQELHLSFVMQLIEKKTTYMQILVHEVDLDNVLCEQMTVIARDFGTPRLQTQNPITVTIFVIRNQFSPVFQNLPYERNMQQTVAAGTSVFRVTATDADTRVHYHLPYLQKNYMLHSSCISKKNYTTVFCFSLLTTR